MENIVSFVRSFVVATGTETAMPDEFWPVLAEHLEDAVLGHSREELDQLSDALSELWDNILSAAPESVSEAVLHNEKSSELSAYWLGQLGFAQLLTMQVAEKRTHNNFFQDMRSDIYKDYIDALAKKDLTGRELAAAVNETEESVSRKLKTLRELGITDYRVIGTSRKNFLTPSARLAIGDSSTIESPQMLSTTKNKILENYKSNRLSPIMQASQSFASITIEIEA